MTLMKSCIVVRVYDSDPARMSMKIQPDSSEGRTLILGEYDCSRGSATLQMVAGISPFFCTILPIRVSSIKT